MMERSLCCQESIISTCECSSSFWVIDTIFTTVCGLVLLFLLLPSLGSGPSSPPLKRQSNIRTRPVPQRWRSRKKSEALKAYRTCLQKLEETQGLISLLQSHLRKLQDKGIFYQHSCQGPLGEVCKAGPPGAHQPCLEPMENAAPAKCSSPSQAPLPECSFSLTSTLSLSPITTLISVDSHSLPSVSLSPEHFLPFDGLSHNPLMLSHFNSCSPDPGAHALPPITPSEPSPPDSTLTLLQCDSVALPLGTISQSPSQDSPWSASLIPGLSHSNCPILALSWWQKAAKALCLSTASQPECQQEHLSHHPPEASFLRDTLTRQAEAGSPSLLIHDVQRLLETLMTKRVQPNTWNVKGNDASDYLQNSFGSMCESLGAKQHKDKGAAYIRSSASFVAEDFTHLDIWKLLEQLLFKRVTPQQHKQQCGIPHRIHLYIELTPPHGTFPAVCLSQRTQGRLTFSEFSGRNLWDAEKMRSNFPARIPPKMGMGKDWGHPVGKTLKALHCGTARCPGKVLGGSWEESERVWLRPLARDPDTNVLNIHLDRKLGPSSEAQMPVDVDHSWLPANHACHALDLPREADANGEAKNPASFKDNEPCMNTSCDILFPSPCTQQLLKARITEFNVRHRWDLPLKVLKPITVLKLTTVQCSPLLQSLFTCSAICAPMVHTEANLSNTQGKSLQLLPEKAVTRESIASLVSSFHDSSAAWEEVQGDLDKTASGYGHEPSDAPLSRQKGRLPSQPLTYIPVDQLWCSPTCTEAEIGCWESLPCLPVSRSEPSEESASLNSEYSLQEVRIVQVSSDAQCERHTEAREIMESDENPLWEVPLDPHLLDNFRAIHVDSRTLRCLGPIKSSSLTAKLVIQDPEEPCFDAQFELQGLVESETQPHGHTTSVVLKDCETGVFHLDQVTDRHLTDYNVEDVFLLADILASQELSFSSQSISGEDLSASQVQVDSLSSGGSCWDMSLKMQDQYGSLGEIFLPRAERPNTGEHKQGQAELGIAQASGICTVQGKTSVESLRSMSIKLEQEGQAIPESIFKGKLRRFMQWVFCRRDSTLKDSVQKGQPVIATTKSSDRGKSRSIMESRSSEAQVLMTAVQQSLEENITLHRELTASELDRCKVELQIPGGQLFHHHRGMVKGDQQVTPNHHSSSDMSGWTRDTKSKRLFPPMEPAPLGRACQCGSCVARLSGCSCQYSPWNCSLQRYVSCGQPECAAYAFPGRTFLQEKVYIIERETSL